MTRPARVLGRLALLALVPGLLGMAAVLWGLPAMGRFLVLDQPPAPAGAIVVLSGSDYLARLAQAAALYRQGLAPRVVINGNRDDARWRGLRHLGFARCCPWQENAVRALAALGVPRASVVALSAPRVYDTISEADLLAGHLARAGVGSILLTTSRYHTRRAGHVFRQRLAPGTGVRVVAARDDPFSPAHWWRHGRQVRQVLTEYGAWLFFFWVTWQGASD